MRPMRELVVGGATSGTNGLGKRCVISFRTFYSTLPKEQSSRRGPLDGGGSGPRDGSGSGPSRSLPVVVGAGCWVVVFRVACRYTERDSCEDCSGELG